MRQVPTRTLFIGIILIFTIWIFHTLLFLAPVETGIGIVLSRMGSVGTNIFITLGDTLQKFSKKEQTSLQTLEERIKRLESENAVLIIAKSENDTLRKQLSFIQQSKFDVQLANRIGWTSDVRRSGFLIDKGKRDGIILSAPVITDGGVLVGKISDVAEATSQVTLINDSKSKITAIVAATLPTTGVVNGQFGLGLIIDLIPMSEKIEIDDIVETSGLEDGIPAGLVIGTISKLNTAPTDLFQTASVRPSTDYTRIRIVSVLISTYGK